MQSNTARNMVGVAHSIIRFITLAGLLWLAGGDTRAQNQTLTPEQWRADLRALAEQLPRLHLNAFHTISRETWQQEVAALDAEIPSLPEHVIIVRLTKLVQMIGDVHTSLNWVSGVRPFKRYPIALFNRADGLFVQTLPRVAPETGRPRTAYQRAIGARLVRVGDYDIAAVKDRLTPLVSIDRGNANWADYYWPELLVTPEFLHATGVTPDPERARFVVEDQSGLQFEFWLTGVERSQLNQITFQGWPGVRRWTTPLVFTRPSTLNYWFEYLPETRTGYFRYRRCVEMPERPWLAFVQEAFNVMLANDVQRLVMDLRDNPGGNEALLGGGIESLKQLPINRRGALFVLINKGTASSATGNANTLQMQTQAILVGEPSGDSPQSYGEVRTFALPNSRLIVNYSTRYFQPPSRNPLVVQPDVVIPYTWEDFQAGRDPVLEYTLRN